MNKIAQYLNRHIVGNVFDKLPIRDAYATDRSIIRNVPRLVAVPETTEDICKLLRFSNQLAKRDLDLPITVRGNGNDKTGAAIGGGIVVSMEHLNRVQEIDPRGRLVRVQAGATLSQINSALKLYGLVLPIAANSNETIGGLISNGYSDDYAGKYGGIYNFVDRAEIVLSNGDIIQTGSLSHHALKRKQNLDTFEGKIYRNLDSLIKKNSELFPKNLNRLHSSGYSSAALVKRGSTFDILPMMFASQGSLGIISEVILRCEVLKPATKRLFVSFHTIRPAIEFLRTVKEMNPLLANIYDNRIFETAIKHGKESKIFPPKLTSGYSVLIEFNDKNSKSKRNIKKCLKKLPKNIHVVVESDKNQAAFAELNSMITGYLNNDIKGERAPVVDDVFIPREHLSQFINGLKELEEKLDSELFLSGSFAVSNYSVRPEIRLDQVEGRQFALKFIKDYTTLIAKNHGSVTGGGPEGCVKALAFKTPPKYHQFYTDIKKTFDPENILNPDIKLGADTKATIRHLRTSYNYYIVTK